MSMKLPVKRPSKFLVKFSGVNWGVWKGRPTLPPPESEKGHYYCINLCCQTQGHSCESVLNLTFIRNDVRYIFEINVGLSTANSAPVSPGGGGWFPGG